MVVQKCQCSPGYCFKNKKLGSNGQNFKNFFRNFEAQIGQKLRNLRLDHFSEFLINKKKCILIIKWSKLFKIEIIKKIGQN